MASGLTDNPWPAFWHAATYPRDPVDYLVYSDWLEERGFSEQAQSMRDESRFWATVRHLGLAPHADGRVFSWWRLSLFGERYENGVPASAWLPNQIFTRLSPRMMSDDVFPMAYFDPYLEDSWETLRAAWCEWYDSTRGMGDWPVVSS